MSSSKKKTAQQTISISPGLKDRIEKYVTENQKKNPKDKRFRSVSAFYTNVLEKTMDCFDKGKTLDDFESFVDSDVKDFFEGLSFNGLIPYYEKAIILNRYQNTNLERNPFFYFTLRRFYTSRMDPYDIKSIKKIFDRVRTYILSNNLTKEFRLDFFSGKGEKNITAVFEQVGLYKNLSFENFKFTAGLFGLLGAKITNFLYSREDIYCRFDMKITDLFYRKELLKRERIKLMQHNLSHILNYNRIVEDKDYFLWMKIAEDKNAFISFTNDETKQEWVKLIESEIEQFGDKDDYHLNILRIFERFHWIEIENEKELLFRIILAKSNNQKDIDYLLKNLSRKSDIIKINGKYQLKKKE
ncbi:MAG: hypothetical protein KGD65_00075 [Candidatus Lokiarchaeota archaeon]|nr:hypothetical protein [Candidatus Lokiarchaeota archaeon]